MNEVKKDVGVYSVKVQVTKEYNIIISEKGIDENFNLSRHLEKLFQNNESLIDKHCTAISDTNINCVVDDFYFVSSVTDKVYDKNLKVYKQQTILFPQVLSNMLDNYRCVGKRLSWDDNTYIVLEPVEKTGFKKRIIENGVETFVSYDINKHFDDFYASDWVCYIK